MLLRVQAYLNDVLMSESMNGNTEHLEAVLHRFKECRVKLNKTKCCQSNLVRNIYCNLYIIYMPHGRHKVTHVHCTYIRGSNITIFKYTFTLMERKERLMYAHFPTKWAATLLAIKESKLLQLTTNVIPLTKEKNILALVVIVCLHPKKRFEYFT